MLPQQCVDASQVGITKGSTNAKYSFSNLQMMYIIYIYVYVGVYISYHLYYQFNFGTLQLLFVINLLDSE